MNYAEHVVDCPTMKVILNELYCRFGCAMNRTTLNAVCHTSFIELLDAQTSSILQQLYFPWLWELCKT